MSAVFSEILIIFLLLLVNGVFAMTEIAVMDLDDFKRLFTTGPLPGEEDDDFHTVGGFVVDRLGHIPVPSEWAEWNGWRFEVADMDRHRVDKILLGKTKATLGPRPADHG